jgi:hypothetical protein
MGNSKCRIKDELALILGLKLNPSKQYRLTQSQKQELKSLLKCSISLILLCL